MAALPLPTNRVMLENLFRACCNNYDSVFLAMQRDHLRMTLLLDCISGRVSADEMEHRRKLLDSTPMEASEQGVPSVEILMPYFDPAALADAKRKVSFGRDAAAEGNVRMHEDPWFVLMIAAGYSAIVEGHAGRFRMLAELRERLGRALAEQKELPPAKPEWNAAAGTLRFRGIVVRTVRGANFAKRLRAILDAFQYANWPEQIPAPQDDPQIMRESIAGLNRGLSLIKFRA